MCLSGSKKSIADLTKDEWNHGTMVAGIISLYGPDNVKILKPQGIALLNLPRTRGTLLKLLITDRAFLSQLRPFSPFGGISWCIGQTVSMGVVV